MITVLVLVAGLAGLVPSAVSPAPAGPAAVARMGAASRPALEHPGLVRLLAAAAGTPGEQVTAPPQGAVPEPRTGSRLEGVATLSGVATGERAEALRRLGLQVHPLEHLPLAFVAGTPAQLQQAVRSGAAVDVYPNERLRYFSAESVQAMSVEPLRAQGLTGKGIGVAVVDSGIDATHPDLEHRVAHNFKVVNGDYFGAPVSNLIPPVLIPVDDLPYRNTDLTTGHGTHVAGIIAADGHTSPEQVGVAPDATIIGYACGDIVFLFTQLAAFDSIMQHRQEWNIRVVNNSWGSSFGMFDPGNPINVATRTMHDAGIAVVLAAGNAGEQMTLSPYAAAPWVISVGASTLDRKRAPFSSAGLEFDNSRVADVPPDNHLRFEGDSLGLYHPDVSAPGTQILSSGTPTAIGITSPALPGGTTSLSGTSMAAPHISGLAALLFQARPDLTPDEVKQVLQVTADPMQDGSALWRSGYGFADGKAALDLVRRPDFGPGLLSRLQAAADARALEQRPYRVLTSDFWRFTAPPVSLGTDVHNFWFDVPDDAVAFRFSVAYPTLPLVGVNLFNYALTLSDANGQV
ncbi:MAG TPA: S8 family serine peptidase, partial [Actinomycetota bacterium]